MFNQILRTINKYKMFEPGDRVIVAVSGGPDSMALLHSLSELNPSLCLTLAAAHLDHGLRRGSHKDSIFVQKAAKSLGIPFFGDVIGRKDIKRLGPSEEGLRRLRYAFLTEIAKKFRAKKIAVGHHSDDQAETVLMRMLRGSGLYGMAAILPKRSIAGYFVVRPLLETSRENIITYLKDRKISYCIDKTNFEDRFLRNKIRNNLLPLLEKDYNPNIRGVLSYLAASVGADYDLLLRQAGIFLKKNLKEKNGVFTISLGRIKKLDIALRRLVLRNILCSLKGDLRLLGFQHLEEIEWLLFSRPASSEVHLPDSIVVKKTKTALEIFSSGVKRITCF